MQACWAPKQGAYQSKVQWVIEDSTRMAAAGALVVAARVAKVTETVVRYVGEGGRIRGAVASGQVPPCSGGPVVTCVGALWGRRLGRLLERPLQQPPTQVVQLAAVGLGARGASGYMRGRAVHGQAKRGQPGTARKHLVARMCGCVLSTGEGLESSWGPLRTRGGGSVGYSAAARFPCGLRGRGRCQSGPPALPRSESWDVSPVPKPFARLPARFPPPHPTTPPPRHLDYAPTLGKSFRWWDMRMGSQPAGTAVGLVGPTLPGPLPPGPAPPVAASPAVAPPGCSRPLGPAPLPLPLLTPV